VWSDNVVVFAPRARLRLARWWQVARLVRDRTVRESDSGPHWGCACPAPEEIAYRCDFIDRAEFTQLAERAPSSDYKAYLLRVVEEPLVSIG
jgi:hypothetical protein